MTKTGLHLAAITAATALSGCALAYDRSPAHEAGTIFAKLPFVTNRSVEPRERGQGRLTTRTGELRGGSCAVEIRGDKSKLLSYELRPLEDTVSSLDADPETGVTVYIHGFNEPFSKNCRYAAVLAERLVLRDSLLLFSWPTNNKVVTYGTDVRKMRATHDSLAQILGLLAAQFGSTNVNVIAHSLGSRGVVDTIFGNDSIRGLRFRKLVLVAPDVDPEHFEASLPTLQRHFSDITVFIAGNDRALSLSQILHRERRLGNATEWQTPDVRVVDVTTLNEGHFFRHMYHVRNPQIATLLRASLLDRE